MKRNPTVAVGRDLTQVVIPGLAGIEAEARADLAEQHIPGAFNVIGGERLTVVPFDVRAYPKRQYRPVVIPGPFAGQFRHD